MTITFGSRTTPLALAHADKTLKFLASHAPQHTFKHLPQSSLDHALAQGDIDFALQPCRDIPFSSPFPIVAYGKRGDPRDALILPQGETSLQPKKPIGCSATSRAQSLSALFPSWTFEILSGDRNTRLAHINQGNYAGLLTSVDALYTLGLSPHRVFSIDEALPPCGQGILAIQSREEERPDFLHAFHDKEAQMCAQAERAFAQCFSRPVVAFAQVLGDDIHLEGMAGDVRDRLWGDQRNPVQLGERLAKIIQETLE